MDSRELKVSIYCTTYNHEKYIAKCLEGFLMQKTSFPFEAIVHDDASSDGTAQIIKEYALRFPSIIKPIFEKENQYSKNDGSLEKVMFSKMRGQYIAVCEGDDYWIDPYKLQKQVDILDKNMDISAVVTNSQIVDDLGYVIQSTISNIVKNNVEGVYNMRDFFHNVHQYPTATVCYRNSHKEEIVKMILKTINPFLGDWTLWIILHTFGNFYFLNQVTSAYRINPTSVTHSNIDERRLGLAKANFKIIKDVQSILPTEYNDIKKELDNKAWMWFKLANAYKHIHKYFHMVYALIRCIICQPNYIIKRLCQPR